MSKNIEPLKVYDYSISFNRRIYANCGAWVDDEYPTFVAVTDNEVQLRDGLDFEIMEKLSRISTSSYEKI